jgi:hypothetical protein
MDRGCPALDCSYNPSPGPPDYDSPDITYKRSPKKKKGATTGGVTAALIAGFLAAAAAIYRRYKYQQTAEKSAAKDAPVEALHDETEDHTTEAPSTLEMQPDSFKTQSYSLNSATLPNTTNPDEEGSLPSADVPSYQDQFHAGKASTMRDVKSVTSTINSTSVESRRTALDP